MATIQTDEAGVKYSDQLFDEATRTIYKHKTILTEHDSWSGSGILAVRYYETKEDALAFAERVNSRNTLAVTPEYYTKVEYMGEVK